MKEVKEEIRMYDDPNLVEYRTNLEGWTGQDGLYQFKGEEAYLDSVSLVFKMPGIRDAVVEWDITFDETLWAPDDKNSFRNIIEIRFKVTGNSSYSIVHLDLRNDIDYYKNCCV